jgi:hypothetical protein
VQVYGKTGYLGEYGLSGTVSEQIASGIKAYSGPLAVKHVGLCTHDGPKETTGQRKYPPAKPGALGMRAAQSGLGPLTRPGPSFRESRCERPSGMLRP